MIIPMLEYTGVAVFAISGALAAGRKSLDLIGVVVIATATAIGGGTLRDLLIDRHPVFWVDQPVYLWIILAAALVTVAYTRRFRPPERSLAYADAAGLALFAISGAQIAEQRGLPAGTVVLMGTMTGVTGSALRDVITGQIPLILRREIYATAAVVGIALYLVLRTLDVPGPFAVGAGILTVAALRLFAIRWDMHLPVFRKS